MRRPLATAGGKVHGQPAARLPVFVGRWAVQRLAVWRGVGISLGSLLVLSAGLCSNARALDTTELKELAQLARAGAPQLALRRMDAAQPSAEEHLPDWIAWEQERLQILSSQGLYPALIGRVQALPESVDPAFRRFALTLQADAQLQLSQADAARATLRQLIWGAGDSSREQQARWRQMVVRSYVLQDRGDDARQALLRYRQDFGDPSAQMRRLNAQVLLQSGDAQSAARLLADDDSVQGQFLRNAARLATSPDQAREVETAVQALVAKTDSPSLQSALWALASAAAAQTGRTLARIGHLEHALSLPIDTQLIHGVIDYNADQLWDAYLQAGKRIGNDEQKLLGNDEDWYFPATQALESDPLRARILFSVLAVYGSSPERRSLAHEYLVGLLDDLPAGRQLTHRLYLESARYRQVDTLPAVIRYRLIDAALESGDLDTASRLMAGLAEPPTGGDRFEWDLRRARVAIYTGDPDTGVALLQRLLQTHKPDWSERQVDRLLQVIFDLQTVAQHDQALQLFSALLDKPLAMQRRRELLFWMADSLQALERYEDAAYLYLKSATLAAATAMDPWSQTARYRAAKSLVEAGLVDDARQIYRQLLDATRDASRKTVLRNELQRLHLVSRNRQRHAQ